MATSSASTAEFRSEQEIVGHFQTMRQKVQETYSKLSELTADIAEHDVVIKALEPMEPKRKCFRLIGEVLVERSVAEVLPAVRKNRDNLQTAATTLEGAGKQMEAELSEFQAKYKIRIVRQNEEEEEEAPEARPSAPSGVLVSK